MATTGTQVITHAKALLDNYTEDGVPIVDSEIVDFLASALIHVDKGQKELYNLGEYRKSIEISAYSVENKLGCQFEVVDFIGDDQYYPNESGIPDIKSYCFEADMTHEVVIQELEGGSWVDLVTKNGTDLAMTQYKGNLTPSTESNNIRMKFTGTTYYRHMNRALFIPQFQDDASVINYSSRVEYTLPTDFKKLDEVIEDPLTNTRTNYSIESQRFYYDYDFSGLIRINYMPIPTSITLATQTLEIDDIACEALGFYVAAWLAPYERQSMFNALYGKYEELRSMLIITQPKPEEKIVNAYFGGI